MRPRRRIIRFTVVLSLGLIFAVGLKRSAPHIVPDFTPPIDATQVGKSRPITTVEADHSASAGQSPTQTAPTLPATANPVLVEGRVTFEPPLRDRLFAAAQSEKQIVRVQLLGGESVPLEVNKHEVLDAESGVVHATAQDEPGSQVLLAYVGQAVAGTMFFPERGLFQIRHVGDGEHRVVQLDPHWMPPCGVGDLLPTNGLSVEPLLLGTALISRSEQERVTSGGRTRPSTVTSSQDPVARPEAATGAPGGMQVKLAWSPSPDASVVGYRLYYGEVTGTRTNQMEAGPALTATVSNLRAGVMYCFFATAYDAAGVESEPSNLVTYTPSEPATVVDILVAYTPATKTANGGEAGVVALINAAIASANTAFANSGAGVALRLAAKLEVNYADSGAVVTDLERLQNPADGYLDHLATARAMHKADLVCLLVHSADDYSGLAYQWTAGTPASAFAPWACSVVVDTYADAYLTLAHEVGHNFGCGHAPDDSGVGAYDYSAAHRFSAGTNQYRTLMAYAPGIRIPHFSNPDVAYLGVPTGTSMADNAQTIRNSRTTIANLQTDNSLYQEWEPIAAASLDEDAHPDLIWRHRQSGRVVVWSMNGTNLSGTAALWTGEASWLPITANRVGSYGPDIIWRNTVTGRVIIWLRNGGITVATKALWSGDPAWVPCAAGDFNQDGVADLVWRHSGTGRVIIWFMSSTPGSEYNDPFLVSTTAIWSDDPTWVPLATGDFNADGKDDLLWRNTANGRVIVWFMDGSTRTGTAVLWTGDASWVPVTTGDFNADGKSDIIWRNTVSGRVIIWFMDGVTQIGTSPIWG